MSLTEFIYYFIGLNLAEKVAQKLWLCRQDPAASPSFLYLFRIEFYAKELVVFIVCLCLAFVYEIEVWHINEEFFICPSVQFVVLYYFLYAAIFYVIVLRNVAFCLFQDNETVNDI